MKKLAQWEEELLKEISTMSNEELFDEMLEAGIADSWDGCFTARGDRTRDIFQRMVRERFADWLAIKNEKKA